MPEKPVLVKRGSSLARLETAFREFDVDESGSISSDNLEAILMRPGTSQTMSKEDVAEIMALFDADGSGTLDLLEFEKAMSMFGSFLTDQRDAFEAEQEVHQNAALSACAAPYADEIREMFGKLDEEGSGTISPTEGSIAKDALVFYYDGMGFEFSDETLVAWNQAHDEGAAGAGLSLLSFGRFLAELAHCEEVQMGGVVEAFGEAVDYILVKRAARRADDAARMRADAKAAGSVPWGASGPRRLKQSGSRMFARLARSGTGY
jgi:hypothetical protein